MIGSSRVASQAAKQPSDPMTEPQSPWPQPGVPLIDEGYAPLPVDAGRDDDSRLERAERLRQAGRLSEARAAFEALDRLPGAARGLGLIALAERNVEAAIEHLSRAAQARPGDWRALEALAEACRASGRAEEGLKVMRTLAALRPGDGLTRGVLAEHLSGAGQGHEAMAEYARAMALRPDIPQIRNNLSDLARSAGQITRAIDLARQALALRPDYAKARNNLAMALKDRGDVAEAIRVLREALSQGAGESSLRHNLLFCLNYDPEISAQALAEEYKREGLLITGDRIALNASDALEAPDPDRRLRIGYVSPDFRAHACAFFIEPLLLNHDPAQVEVVCYAENPGRDAVTDRLRAAVDSWRVTKGVEDRAVAEQVMADRVDILVDLAGHTVGNRLGVFAWKPAPLQGTWLGHGGTSGLPAMDFALADARLAPPGADAFYTEAVERLPEAAFCYRPPADAPEVAASPAGPDGPITFGCFSRATRLNDRVIQAWVALLNRVPDSRLVLNTKAMGDPGVASLFRRRFAARGVPPERLILTFTTPQPETWKAYNLIDIALDPFPHNAGTTTFEASWMGVPVVSLRERPPLGRFGDSILGALGLEDLVADSVEGYVEIAAALATDRARLAALRAGLRARMRASALCDEAAFAGAVETAFRGLWRRWCAGGHPAKTA